MNQKLRGTLTVTEYKRVKYQECIANPDCKERRRQNSARAREKCKTNPECLQRVVHIRNRSTKAARENRLNLGLCGQCTAPSLPGHHQCSKHLNKARMMTWLRKCRAVEILGGACAMCGQDDVRILEFDHTNNDGKQHRKEIRTSIATWITKHPDTAAEHLQVLCANCHAYKRYEEEMR